jgi:hypothetical protein
MYGGPADGELTFRDVSHVIPFGWTPGAAPGCRGYYVYDGYYQFVYSETREGRWIIEQTKRKKRRGV